MTRLSLVAALLLAQGATAFADISPNDISISSFNPDDAVAPVSSVEGPGVKIGEGTVLHPVFGVETGFVSNTFYDNTDVVPSGLLRLIAQVATSSLGDDRLQQYDGSGTDVDQPVNRGNFEYRASVRLSYDLPLSGNETVRDTGGLGAGVSLHGLVNPMGRWRFGIDEDYLRLIRAANFETDANTNRDLNNIQLSLWYQPPDRAFGGYLYYRNTLDIFEEGTQSFADRMFNRLGVHPTWQWLPHTQIYGDFSWGVTTPLSNEAVKSGSYPLNVLVGANTLFTLKTTFNVFAGYTNGFYSKAPSYSAPMAGANLGYRYSPMGRVQLGYYYVHEDSINANFFRDHVIRASLQQLFVPFVVMVQPEVHFREYNGVNQAVPGIMAPDTRNDIIVALVAGVHYNFRNWFAATVNYRLTSDQTDFTYMVNGFSDDPSYVRQEILVGVRAAL